MKLWQKKVNVKKEVDQFTVGKDRELDIQMAEFDVLGSIAHSIMLGRIGLLTGEESSQINKELKHIYTEIKTGKFEIERDMEDIHSQVEFLLTNRLGETGKKIHSGRSRNDQSLLDIKLFIRNEIQQTVKTVKSLFDQLIALSEEHKNKLLPGYTHLQLAMPSSFGLWFASYAESLVDDLILVEAAYRISNKSPLGSGAGYGSSFPLDRQLTAALLGFESMNYNVVYAQMSRGKTERIVSMALSGLAATLAKMAMDICLYMNQNFGFISFPDELTTGSSIMPHKKNPDAFEIIRAKCNKLQALPNEIAFLITNLPSGYHRDLQLTKESLFPAFKELNSCLEMAEFMLKHITVKENILDKEKYKYLFSVEAVNTEVLKGKSFRDAYKKVGEEIENGFFFPDTNILHTHQGSIGNLCNDKIREMMEKVIFSFRFERVNRAMKKLLS